MEALDPALIIGGCGGLGFHIVSQLLQSGDAANVTVLDIDTDRNRVAGARYVNGSVSSTEDISTVLEEVKPRVIFHVASPHLMLQNATPRLFKDVNVFGTKKLLDCIYEQGGVKILIYTSSTGIIHNGYTDIINATEDAPIYLNHPEYYARTKAQAEVMFREANRKEGLLTCALRCPTLYGEGDNTTIPQIVNNAKAGRGKMQVGDGQNMFDYLYLGNAALAHRLAAKKLLQVDATAPPAARAERIDGEVFIISNDEVWKPVYMRADGVTIVGHLADKTIAMEILGLRASGGYCAGCGVPKEQVKVVPTWVYYAMAVVAEWTVWLFTLGHKESQINRKMIRFFKMTNTFDISKAKVRLGYRPQWTTQEGIDRAVRALLQSEEGKKFL